MNLADLKQTIAAHFADGKPDELALDAELLGDGVAALFAACLGLEDGASLALAEPSIFLDAEPPVLHGTATFLSVDEVDVEVRLGEENDEATIQIWAPMPSGWSFGTSFPKLPPFLSFASRDAGYRRSFLNHLSLSDSTFVLATHDFADDETGLKHKRGLNYAANLYLAKILAPFVALVGEPKPLTIGGLISDGTDSPEFSLSAAFPLELGDESFGFQRPELVFHSSLEESEAAEGLPDEAAEPDEPLTPVDPDAPPQEPPADDPADTPPADDGAETDPFVVVNPDAAPPADDAPPAEPTDEPPAPDLGEAARKSRVELLAPIVVASKRIELTTEFQLGARLDFIALTARAEGGLMALSDLAELTGGADLEGALPAGLTLGNPVVEEFTAGFGLRPRSLAYVGTTISTSEPWEIVPNDILVVKELTTRWLIESPLKALGRRLSCEIEGTITIAGVSFDAFATLPEGFLAASLSEGSTIALGDLLNQLASGAPPAPAATITQLDLMANPRLRTFSLATLLEDALRIPPDGDADVEIKQIAFGLDYAPGGTVVTLAGVVSILQLTFSVAARWERTRPTPGPTPPAPPAPTSATPSGAWRPTPRPPATNVWNFKGALDESTSINLGDLIARFDETLVPPDDTGLRGLEVRRLSFAVDTGTEKRYSFGGALNWEIPLGAGEKVTVAASLDIESWIPSGTLARQKALSVGGKVSFEGFDSAFFQNLTISALYTSKPLDTAITAGAQAIPSEIRNEIVFIVARGGFQLLASIEYGTKKDTIFTLTLDGTLGEMLTFLAQMADPSIEEFTLDEPWDELLKTNLKGLSLKVNVTQREVGFEYGLGDGGNGISIGGIITVKKITAQYMRPRLADKVTPDLTKRPEMVINVVISGLGAGEKPLGWNPLTQPAPAVPGKGSSVFDLSYLGIGQHVAISQDSVKDLTTVTEFITALRLALTQPADTTQNPLAKKPPADGIATGPQDVKPAQLVFSPDSGWLIGAQLSLLGAIDLSVIFNDPLVYGLRLGLHGSLVQQLAGLEFEILYRRISDTIGVYHVELVLPDAIRYIQVGIVAITIPVIVIDIYTNGDFKLDIGFPWKNNFERSFGVQVLIFTGAAGFYFNKLSGATATNMPALTNGAWGTVLQFGLGLKIGVGRNFHKGPLKAELSIALMGVVEGAIAWFQPSDPGTPEDKYFILKGTVGIVGRLYGEVDLSIITADIEVVARALIAFRYVVYEPVFIKLSVEVSVTVKVKVVFVTIGLSFSTTISAEFTLGSYQPTPWKLASTLGGGVMGAEAPAPAPALWGRSTPRRSGVLGAGGPLAWAGVNAVGTNTTISLFFEPALSRDENGTVGVALLFVPTSQFAALADAVLAWAVHADAAINPDKLALADLEGLHALLVGSKTEAPALFDLGALTEFLAKNFTFALAPAAADFDGALFPVFPGLALTLGASTVVQFSGPTATQLTPEARDRVAAFFASLRVSRAPTPPANQGAATLAEFVFCDYFALVARSAVQVAADYLRDMGADVTTNLADLRQKLLSDGKHANAAGMVSRFLLHGLRLPWDNDMRPLYALTGQQFALSGAQVGDAGDTFSLKLTKPATMPWLQLPGFVAGKSDPLDLPFPIGEKITPELWALKGALEGSRIPKDLLAAPKKQAAYTLAPRRFGFARPNGWQPNGPSSAQFNIFALPDELRDALRARSGAASDLRLLIGQPDKRGELPKRDIPTVKSWAYAARVELTVRRIPTPDGAGSLTATYALVGSDEAGRHLLEELWKAVMDRRIPHTLSLLYRAASNDAELLASDASNTCFVLKTNLSTESTSGAILGVLGGLSLETDYSATLANTSRFVQLVWQCSTVNTGGFFLHYNTGTAANPQGLPDALFTDGQSAKLVLLAQGEGNLPPAPCHNCVVVRDALPTDAVVFAELPDLAPTITRAPGTFAVRLERPRLDDAAGAANALPALYHMLAFQIVRDDNFEGSAESLPIGPADDDPTTSTDDTLWVYERAIPLATYAKPIPTNANDGMPPASADPYRGVGNDATLAFEWQDIYGNRIGANLEDMTAEVRYADELIGMNQWPGVAEHYAIAADGDTVTLRVELSFDQSAYAASAEAPAVTAGDGAEAGAGTHGDLHERVRSARDTFERVFYQLHQPDVRFVAHSSLLRDDGGAERGLALEKNDAATITAFTDACYRYLATLAASTPVLHTAEERDTLQSVADRYSLQLAALADANADAPDPLGNGQTLAALALAQGGGALVADVARANANEALRIGAVLLIPAHLALPAGAQTTNATTLETLAAALQDRAGGALSVAEVAYANQNTVGLLAQGVVVPPPAIRFQTDPPDLQFELKSLITRANETLATLTAGFAAQLDAAPRLAERITVARVAAAAASVAGLLKTNAAVLVPPAQAAVEVALGSRAELAAALPAAMIFPLTVQLDIARAPTLCDADVLALVPTVGRASAFLSPRTLPLAPNASAAQETASLRPFATDFEKACEGLRLALGNETPHAHSSEPDDGVRRPLWAVQFGVRGIEYNINESYPFFFSPRPLANTPISGDVFVPEYAAGAISEPAKSTRVEATDLNALARDFLGAVEAFLEPQSAVPALMAAPTSVSEVLRSKGRIADAVPKQVTPILAQTDDANISERKAAAGEKLRQQLLIDLAQGYDIETVVQYNVDVTLHRAAKWPSETAPRLVGQPVVIDPDGKLAQTLQALDIHLSAAKVPLPGEKADEKVASHLTFFLNTHTPEKLRELKLPLMFRTNEVEHDIVDVGKLGEAAGTKPISNYQASSWLSFVLPQTGEAVASNPNYIGAVEVPVPLRAYPIPPSLLQQRAVADQDSYLRLEQVREWEYQYVYEHLDAAQDTIESRVSYALVLDDATEAPPVSATSRALFEKLVRFARLHPLLLPDLAASNPTAIATFAGLVNDVANAWEAWQADKASAGARTPQYEISEAANPQTPANKNVTIRWADTAPPPKELPSIMVPGYAQYRNGSNGADAKEAVYHYAPKTPEQAALDPVFGESSIPDRVVSVPSLDIIAQQSAWGAVWVTRNKGLVEGRDTNPAFLFQTPQVRFGSPVTPLLVNTKRWQIEAINPDDKAPRSLARHIELLFATLLPQQAPLPYDIRVTVRYAFALAEAGGDDLLSTLPVILGPRFTVVAGAEALAATATFRAALTTALTNWKAANRPLEALGEYIFSVALFSSRAAQGDDDKGNLPLLQVEDLRLPLGSIA